MLGAITDHIVFAAPEPTYDASNFTGSLCWIPWAQEDKPGDVLPAKDGAIGPPDAQTEAELCDHPSTVPCLWFPANQLGAVVLYFHANGEDLGMIYSTMKTLHEQLQVGVLAVEYPGYGMLRSASASEASICAAAEKALRYLAQDVGVGYSKVLVLGRSLGSGPAVHLAARFPVGGLILVNAFTSIRAAVESHTSSALKRVAGLAFREAFDNERDMSRVSASTLLIHARGDKMVPPEHSQRLFQRCRARKLLIMPDGMDHNSYLFSNPAFLVLPMIHFFQLLHRFWKRCLPELPQKVFTPPVDLKVGMSSPAARCGDAASGPWRCKVLPPWFCLVGNTQEEVLQDGAQAEVPGRSSDGRVYIDLGAADDDIKIQPGDAPLGTVEVAHSVPPSRAGRPSVGAGIRGGQPGSGNDKILVRAMPLLGPPPRSPLPLSEPPSALDFSGGAGSGEVNSEVSPRVPPPG